MSENPSFSARWGQKLGQLIEKFEKFKKPRMIWAFAFYSVSHSVSHEYKNKVKNHKAYFTKQKV